MSNIEKTSDIIEDNPKLNEPFAKKQEINKLTEHLHKVANQLGARNVTWDIIQLKKKLYEAVDRASGA